MTRDGLDLLIRLHHSGPGLKLDSASGLSATVRPAHETVTELLKLALAGLHLEKALEPVTAVETSNARQTLKNRRKRLTDRNIAEEVMSARRDNYSVYWRI